MARRKSKGIQEALEKLSRKDRAKMSLAPHLKSKKKKKKKK